MSFTAYLTSLPTVSPFSPPGGSSGGGGIAGDGKPQDVYPSGPPGGQEGTPYVNRLTNEISWWYNGQWNP